MDEKACTNCGENFARKPGWSRPLFAKTRFCSNRCAVQARWNEPGYRERVGASRRAYNEAHPEENAARVAKTAATRGMAFPGVNPVAAGRARAATLLRLSACTDCGVGYTGPRSLHRHHIDHDPTNNSLVNLVVLCVPCHEHRHDLDGVGFGGARVKPRVCPMCGVTFRPDRDRRKMCSATCGRLYVKIHVQPSGSAARVKQRLQSKSASASAS